MELIVQSNLIPALREEIPRAVSQAVRKAAFDVERLAKESAPVDTGALKASIYVSVEGGAGDYEAARAAASAKQADARSAGKTPKGRSAGTRAAMLEEVKPTEPLTAYVAVGAEYGAAVEAKQPFLLPALERVRAGFEEAVRQALGGTGKK